MTDDLQKFLDELRSRISIAEIIGQKVKLVKRGREYTGLCPFHHEKTPSFTINESKGFYQGWLILRINAVYPRILFKNSGLVMRQTITG